MSTTDESIEAVNWIIIKKVADDVSISFVSYQLIFTDVLGTKRSAAIIVLKLLNFEQKTMSYGHRFGYVDNVQNHPNLLRKVAAGNESWVYGYNIETKAFC